MYRTARPSNKYFSMRVKLLKFLSCGLAACWWDYSPENSTRPGRKSRHAGHPRVKMYTFPTTRTERAGDAGFVHDLENDGRTKQYVHYSLFLQAPLEAYFESDEVVGRVCLLPLGRQLHIHHRPQRPRCHSACQCAVESLRRSRTAMLA